MSQIHLDLACSPNDSMCLVGGLKIEFSSGLHEMWSNYGEPY